MGFGITEKLNNDIRNKKIAEMAETERKLANFDIDDLDVNEIVKFVSDSKNTVTNDYIIRKFIVENLAETLLPKDTKIYKKNNGRVWSKKTVSIVADNLRKLQKDKGIKGNIKWESYLVPNQVTFKNKSAFKIAFTLGMDAYETGKLLCAWDGNYFDVHDPLSLSAYFCMSDEALNKYEIYEKISAEVSSIFATVQDYDEIDNKKHFFDNIPDENVTEIMLHNINNDELTSMNQDEKIEAFIKDVENNAKTLKMYTTSNSNRRIVKMLIDDIKKVYANYDFNDIDYGIDEEDKEKKKIEVDVYDEFQNLMKNIRETYLKDYSNVSKKIKTELPKSIENTINNLQSDITNIAHGTIRHLDITKDVFLKKYITENLSAEILPSYHIEKNKNIEAEWDKDIIKIAVENLRKLQMEKEIDGEIEWESLLTGKEMTYSTELAIKIAFTLGMGVDELDDFVQIWDNNFLKINDPLCLSAYFCLSDNDLNEYGIYKKISTKVCKIFDSEDNLKDVNGKDNKYKNMPEKDKMVAVFDDFNENILLDSSDRNEKIEAFFGYVENNVKDLKTFISRKKTIREYKVERRSVIMLIYLMLQQYIEQLRVLIGEKYNDESVDRVDCSFIEPLTLFKDFTVEGDREFHDRAYDIAAVLSNNEEELNAEVIEDKMNLFIDVVNHFMDKMNMFPFYLPNEIDKFFLLVFMTNNPSDELNKIIEKYSK